MLNLLLIDASSSKLLSSALKLLIFCIKTSSEMQILSEARYNVPLPHSNTSVLSKCTRVLGHSLNKETKDSCTFCCKSFWVQKFQMFLTSAGMSVTEIVSVTTTFVFLYRLTSDCLSCMTNKYLEIGVRYSKIAANTRAH